MGHFAIPIASFATESAKQVELINVRDVTKRRKMKLSAAKRRSVEECDRIMADSGTTWHPWSDVRKQLGL